jgi:hypothetical protein
MFALSACTWSKSYQLLSQSDSLLNSHPDSALKILDGINDAGRLSEEGIMHYLWNQSMAHMNMGMSLEQDTLTLDAVNYYRKKGDTTKTVDGYLLSASYLSWTGKTKQAIDTLNKGYSEAVRIKDVQGATRMLIQKIFILSRSNSYAQAVSAARQALKNGNQLPVSERSKLTYILAENLSLLADKSAPQYYEQAIAMAKSAGNNEIACEIMRNYSSSLCVSGQYRKSNNLLFEIGKVNPELFKYSVIQMSIAENYVNLHRLDSARIFIENAKKSEAKLLAAGQGNLNRQASIDRICYLLNYQAGKPVSSVGFNRYCDSVTNAMIDQEKTSIRRLEMKKQLQTANNGLHSRLQTMIWWIFALLLIIAIAAIGVYQFYKNRYRKLAEAEDSIETLKKMLTDAQTPSADDQRPEESTDSAFFKKILLQQLGIIRLVASTPTNQNQALLRRISGISGGEISTDSLLVWADLYPVIDRLYNDFHSRLVAKFGNSLTEKEIQICCLLCAGFSTKEIGVITQQTNATIYVRKTSIRKKIGAAEGEDIVTHISAL